MEISYIANILLPILKYYVALATCNNKSYIPFFKLEFLNFYLYLENYLLSDKSFEKTFIRFRRLHSTEKN